MRSRSTAIFTLSLLAVAICVGFVLPAEAVNVTWNTTSSCLTDPPGPPGPSCAGNTTERTFTASGGQVLTVRAFSSANAFASGAHTGNFVAAALGLYTAGLGVTAPGSQPSGDGTGTNNQHAADNYGKGDLIVFKFPDAGYVPLSTFLTQFICPSGCSGVSSADINTDIKAWVGGAGKTFSNFTSLSFSTLTPANGFQQYPLTNGTTTPGAFLDGDGNRSVNLNFDPPGLTKPLNLAGLYLIIAPDPAEKNDGFKIGSIVGTTSVPEPATLTLLALGAAGVGFLRRRR